MHSDPEKHERIQRLNTHILNLILAALWLIVIAIAAACFAKAAHGATSAQQTAARSVCSIDVGHTVNGREFINLGTGTYIGGSPPMVITCGHLFEAPIVRPRCTWPNGSSVAATRVSYDPRQEIGIIFLTEKPAGVAPVPIAETPPAVSAPVCVVGYSGTNIATIKDGYKTPTPKSSAGWDELRLVNSRLIDGDSGGPVLNASGELAGVLWGGTYSTSYAPLRSLRQYLNGRCIGNSCFLQPIQPVRPIQPIQPAPPITIQPIQPATQIDYDLIVSRVVEAIRQDPNLRGQDGAPGPPGKDGKDGPRGPAGPTSPVAQLDYDAITLEILKRIDYNELASKVVQEGDLIIEVEPITP